MRRMSGRLVGSAQRFEAAPCGWHGAQDEARAWRILASPVCAAAPANSPPSRPNGDAEVHPAPLCAPTSYIDAVGDTGAAGTLRGHHVLVRCDTVAWC